MPKVGGKHFPYTKEGYKAAEVARTKPAQAATKPPKGKK
mgnify:FL=1